MLLFVCREVVYLFGFLDGVFIGFPWRRDCVCHFFIGLGGLCRDDRFEELFGGGRVDGSPSPVDSGVWDSWVSGISSGRGKSFMARWAAYLARSVR